MRTRYRLITRNSRGGGFYSVDSLTGKRTSLGTVDRDAAEQIVLAKNQALRQPSLNLHIAKAYLAGSDSGVNTRTWQNALDAVTDSKQGPTRQRWVVAAKDKAFDLVRRSVIVETRAESLLAVLIAGTVSTNVHLRKLHNYCLDMGWLPWPIIPKRQWPPVHYGAKRAIRFEEHFDIIDREPNPERRAFYELCWHLGGAQGYIANLAAEDIDWDAQMITYFRRKTHSAALIRFGDDVERILRQLPATGPLFPSLRGVRASDRATEFKRRCKGLGIEGITLHSYRYAWAERAKTAGYPERFAQEALGHNSKAVHRAYALHAEVTIPSLDDYERNARARKVVKVGFRAQASDRQPTGESAMPTSQS